MKLLGFDDVVEAAIGADLCTIEEAKDFMREVPEHQPFYGDLRCPAWSVILKSCPSDFAPSSPWLATPMVLTACLIKKEHKNCKVVSLSDLCAAKKLSQPPHDPQRRRFCFDLEEVMGMFEAKAIKFAEVAPAPN